MVRLISGACALALMGGTYVVCPEAMRQRMHETLTPPDETLAEMRAGLDALADHFDGPWDMNPDVRSVSAARE
ncbi:MAG: hypothetical protein ACLFQ5_05205 [Oceanicaulis sp.]